MLFSVLQHGLAPRDIEEMLEVGSILPSQGSIVAGFLEAVFQNLFYRKYYSTMYVRLNIVFPCPNRTCVPNPSHLSHLLYYSCPRVSEAQFLKGV